MGLIDINQINPLSFWKKLSNNKGYKEDSLWRCFNWNCDYTDKFL